MAAVSVTALWRLPEFAAALAGFDAEQGLVGQISLMLWRAYVANLQATTPVTEQRQIHRALIQVLLKMTGIKLQLIGLASKVGLLRSD